MTCGGGGVGNSCINDAEATVAEYPEIDDVMESVADSEERWVA
jgi:hypothetical protein